MAQRLRALALHQPFPLQTQGAIMIVVEAGLTAWLFVALSLIFVVAIWRKWL
jgi:hypothetical protein